jgi:pimeloyl-ACP methyl ester carboxylesterase
MNNLRKYGSKPYNVAVIHGGPGAPGQMAPVARELSSVRGILEPLQTKTTIEEQVKELKNVLDSNGTLPVTLIGFSWGAMLGFIFTACNTSYVNKLILVSSGPYEEKYAEDIMRTRLNRLGDEDRQKLMSLQNILDRRSAKDKDLAMAQFGKLMSRADSYEPLPHDDEILHCQYDIYNKIWDQAMELRSSGQLLELGKKIECPVVAIHGNYDPHPSEGVREPLSGILKDFRLILLEKCGHYPWVERYAKDRFYYYLKNEIKVSRGQG